MFNKLKLFFNLFHQGEEVADAAKWKNHQITVNTLAALLATVVALSKAFGYEIPISDDQLAGIGGGLFALTNVLLTIITSTKVGLPARPESEPAKAASGGNTDHEQSN